MNGLGLVRSWACGDMSLSSTAPKLLVIGDGGHGKDTAAKIIAAHCGLSFMSASEFAAQHVVFPLMRDSYATWQECFRDRGRNRARWFSAISDFDALPGPTLIEQVLAVHSIYVGLRSRSEFEAARGMFDLVVWVDRSEHEPPEGSESMELTAEDADFVLDNNGCLDALEGRILEMILG